MSAEHDVIQELKNSVLSMIERTGSNNEITQSILTKLESLQSRLKNLPETEKSRFLAEMQDSFRETIKKVEQKLTQHSQFEQIHNYSVAAAVILLVVLVFALFGYKLYKSLKEKELKKQGKLKGKQSKKAKKSN